MNAVKIGWARFFAGIFDALTDPIMGQFSDNFRSRWGRRRPFILTAGPLSCILFFFLWTAPASFSEMGIFYYILILQLAYSTVRKVAMVPHFALGAELSPDYNERTRIYSVRALCARMGALFAVPIWQISTNSRLFPSTRAGFGIVMLVISILGIIAFLWVVMGTREKAEGQKRPKMPFLPGLKYTLTNKPFLIILISFLFLIVGVFTAFPFSRYINIYYVFNGDQEAAGPVMTVSGYCSQALQIAGIFFFGWLGVRIGKRNALFISFLLLAIVPASSWWLFTPEHPWRQLWFSILLAPAIPGLAIFPGAMIADVIDLDEVSTGRRREGAFSAVFGVVFKVFGSLTFLWIGYVLDFIGFDETIAHQEPGALTRLRLILALAPILLIGISALVLLFYPIDEKAARKTRALLERRRLEQSEDPLASS